MSSGQVGMQDRDDEVERTKQQIRGLVGEIAQLAKSDLEEEEFFSQFLNRVIQALAAVGGAVWTLGEGRTPELAFQINLSPSLLDKETDDSSKHFRLLNNIVNSNQPALIPPMSSAGDERAGGNPTRQLLVVAPLGHDGEVEGLIEIFQRPNTPPDTQKGYLRFLMQMTEIVAEWFKNRKLRHFSDRHSLWAQADQFSRAVHESLDLRETCYTVVNEGRRLMGCDRVSIGLLRGGKCTVDAISGQDTLDNRSNVVTLLSRLATRVVASGEPLWYLGKTEDLPPQIEEALDEYVDHSYTKSLAVIPLRRPVHAPTASQGREESTEQQGEIIGAMVVEQIESEIPREILNPRLDLVLEHACRAIANAQDHNTLFLMPLWKAIGHSKFMVTARNLPKTLTIGGAVLAILLLSIVVPWNFDMRGKGELQPVKKHDLFAPETARVDEVLISDEMLDKGIEKGAKLVVLSSDELRQQTEQVEGEFKATQEKYITLERQLTSPTKQTTGAEDVQLQAEVSKLKQQLESLRKQQAILKERADRLVITSDWDGRIMTWNPKKSLEKRPVGVGQVLLTIAERDSEFYIEVFMPEHRVRHMQSYLKEQQKTNSKFQLAAEFILMTDPGRRLSGKVTEIGSTAEPHEERGNMVRVKVTPDVAILDAKPGTSVTVDIHCGHAPFLWTQTHEAWEWLQKNVFFWF